jgi:hypothetical protein
VGPCWYRIDGHHREEGMPLLQALTDVHTEDEYDRRQEQREQAAKAEKKRRDEAKKRELAAEWAQAEWFETRERRMEGGPVLGVVAVAWAPGGCLAPAWRERLSEEWHCPVSSRPPPPGASRTRWCWWCEPAAW